MKNLTDDYYTYMTLTGNVMQVFMQKPAFRPIIPMTAML